MLSLTDIKNVYLSDNILFYLSLSFIKSQCRMWSVSVHSIIQNYVDLFSYYYFNVHSYFHTYDSFPLFYDTVPNTADKLIMNGESEQIWEGALGPIWNFYPNIRLQVLNKTVRNNSQHTYQFIDLIHMGYWCEVTWPHMPKSPERVSCSNKSRQLTQCSYWLRPGRPEMAGIFLSVTTSTPGLRPPREIVKVISKRI